MDFAEMSQIFSRHKPQKYWLFDVGMVFIILITSFYISFSELNSYRRSGGTQIAFYQMYFEPAVSLACGRGFAVHNPPIALSKPFESYFIQKENTSSPLAQFLFLKRESFDCSELPPPSNMNNKPPQRNLYYMISSVGLLWKIFGISWSIVDKLVAGLFSISIALSYLIFRLGMRRILAIPLTILLCGSLAQLTFIPWLQDYAKAPFFLAIFYILGLFVVIPPKRYYLSILAAIAGVMFGIGYGFRPDILIAAPPIILTILFFIPGGTFNNLFQKIIAILIMIAAFYLTAQPILNNNIKSGTCIFDTSMEGLTPIFSSALNLNVSPIYEMGHQYNDLLTNAMVSAHAEHYLHLELDSKLDPSTFNYCSRPYSSAAFSLYKYLIEFSPADILIRAYASANQILNLSFISWQNTSFPPHQSVILAPTDNLISRIHQFTKLFLVKLNGHGIFLSILAIFLIGIFQLRVAIVVLLAVTYFSFYPAIQFNPRHFFHLEFISLWFLGFLFNQVFSIHQIKQQFNYCTKRELTIKCFQSGLLIICSCMLASLLLFFARKIQTKNVEQLIISYKISEKKLLHKSNVMINKDTTLVKLEPWRNVTSKQYAIGKMLLIEFGGDLCSKKNVDYTVVYDFDKNIPGYFNFSKTDTSPIFPNDEKTQVFTPIFQSKYYHFEGIQLKTEDLHCLGNIYILSGLKDNPLWLFLKLPPTWQDQPLYQTMKDQ